MTPKERLAHVLLQVGIYFIGCTASIIIAVAPSADVAYAQRAIGDYVTTAGCVENQLQHSFVSELGKKFDKECIIALPTVVYRRLACI